MAVNYKILGQAAPQSTTVDLYTTPANTQALISTLVVCNRGNSATSFRVAARKNGATLATQHYINYDVPIAANDSINLTLGISLAATDVLTVTGNNDFLSFTAFGSEITAA